MGTLGRFSVAAVVLLVAVGCGPGEPGTNDSGHLDAGGDAGDPKDAGADAGTVHDAGTDAGSPGDGGTDAGSIDAGFDAGSTDAGVDAGAFDAGPVTYSGAAQAVYQAHCAPCHLTGGSGGANFAAGYSATQLASYYCPGETKGACTLVRIQEGSMPFNAGCTGDPAQDSANAACLTAAEQQTLQAWISGGQLP
ncbi:MAG: hypothetical protein ACYC8T_39630 [Myxococcaceae bacterium]